MRTALFLLAGLLFMASAQILARLFTPELPGARQWAFWLAVVVWFALTVFNLWVGVSKAGYSVRDELPVFLLLFAVPVAAHAVARHWLT